MATCKAEVPGHGTIEVPASVVGIAAALLERGKSEEETRVLMGLLMNGVTPIQIKAAVMVARFNA